MSKRTAQDRSRRAFLARAGGVGALMAVGAAPRAEAGPPESSAASHPRDYGLVVPPTPGAPSQPGGYGLWVTWYDLPDAQRTEHLAWVHDTDIPALLKRPR